MRILLFLKRHTSEVRLVLTTVLVIAALLLGWNSLSHMLQGPALIAAPLLLLVVLAFCPLSENMEDPDDAAFPVWKACLCALTVVMLYLVWPSVWGIVGCVALMGVAYFLGMLCFGMACIGAVDDSAAEW